MHVCMPSTACSDPRVSISLLSCPVLHINPRSQVTRSVVISRVRSFRPANSRSVGSVYAGARGGSNGNPFITNKGSDPHDEEWSSRPEDEQRLKKASSVDLSLPALGKQQIKAKAAFPWVTKLLVSALVVLFAVQWWPFLTNFQHQTSFITTATHSKTGPSSFLPALKHLTFSVPEPGHWSDLTVAWMLDRSRVMYGQWWRFYTTTLLHANLLHLLANCVAIHEFGKDLEAQVGKLQYLAVLVFSAYASGLFMVVTNRPIGAEAFLPVGASGLVTGITSSLFLMSLFLKNLRQQGTLESSGAALVIAFLLGQFVPALDNGIHAGGLLGGIAAALIILIQYGISGVFKGRRTTAAGR
ncbi:hypothetical protein ABBQ32_012350 [Trebouxia sp. C0010 RCD-2024]